MPSQNQITTKPLPEDGSLRQSSVDRLLQSFPASPVLNQDPELAAESLNEYGNQMLLDGEVADGYGLSLFNRDYAGVDSSTAPPIKDNTSDPDGHFTLSGPYTPTLTSPGRIVGAVNIDPSTLPKGPEAPDPGTEFGTGEGHLLDPSDSSKQQSQAKIGEYLLGRTS